MVSILCRDIIYPLQTVIRILNSNTLSKTRWRTVCVPFQSSRDLAERISSTLPNYQLQQSVDDILSEVENRNITGQEAVTYLKYLRVQKRLNNMDFRSISNTLPFRTLCRQFEDKCDSIKPALLVSGLRSLLEIGMGPKSSCVEQAEMVIFRNIAAFSMIELIGCLHLHSKNPCEALQNQVVAALVESIQNRFEEITMSSEALMLVEILHFFDETFVEKIVKKIELEIMNSMTCSDLTKLICLLSDKNNRCKQLLNAAAHHITRRDNKPNLKDTIDILYALNNLNFYESCLLSYLTKDRADEIRVIKQASIVSQLLTVCGHLRWRHSDILLACGRWIEDNFSSCTSKEFVSYILTIAALNFRPPENFLIDNMLSKLKMEAPNISKDIWLDVVWSLSVIGHVEKETLMNVLSKEFYQPLIDGDSFHSVSNRLKLMNLKSCLKNSYPECVFSCDLYLDSQELPENNESKSNRNFVIKTLGDYIPIEKYVGINFNTDMGIHIDAEFILNEKGKPLLLQDYGLKSKPIISAKPLPKGVKRIAMLIWLFKDYTLGEKTLTGVNALAVSLLSNEGYTIIQIPYSDFPKKATDVQRVSYLASLINAAVTENADKTI